VQLYGDGEFAAGSKARRLFVAHFAGGDQSVCLRDTQDQLGLCGALHVMRAALALLKRKDDEAQFDHNVAQAAINQLQAAAAEARALDSAVEAECYSEIAHVYGLLGSMPQKEAYAKRSLDTALQCSPRTFERCAWWVRAKDVIMARQKRVREDEERRDGTNKAPVKEKLKDVLKQLDEWFERGTWIFLQELYQTHGAGEPFPEELARSNLKKAYQARLTLTVSN